ncbi:MAG: hypothetical protein QM642_01140 [Edaphocola sp.]
MEAANFKALIGVFDIDMQPEDVDDVSQALVQFLDNEGQIIFPEGFEFKQFLPQRFSKKQDRDLFLQLKFETGRIFNIKIEKYKEIIKCAAHAPYDISIVYNVYIDDKTNWRSVVSSQLYDLKSFGLLDEANLYVCLTYGGDIQKVAELIQDICDGKAIIAHSKDNTFEYPGISLLYELAASNPEKLFFYLHTKGMSTHTIDRTRFNWVLTNLTFGRWRYFIQYFSTLGVNKIGLFPARDGQRNGGWVWFNFFMVTGKYLLGREKPVLTKDRYYYESWLGIQNSDFVPDDNFSIFSESVKTFEQPEVATEFLKLSYDNYFGIKLLLRRLLCRLLGLNTQLYDCFYFQNNKF